MLPGFFQRYAQFSRSTLTPQYSHIVSTFLGCIRFCYQFGEVIHEWMKWQLGRKAFCRLNQTHEREHTWRVQEHTAPEKLEI